MPVWNVFFYDFNKRRIVPYNIFDHASFREDCKKHAKKYAQDPEKFAEEVKHELHYYFWCKCEYEIILSGWPPKEDDDGRKVDICQQVLLNWDVFIAWLWEHRKEL